MTMIDWKLGQNGVLFGLLQTKLKKILQSRSRNIKSVTNPSEHFTFSFNIWILISWLKQNNL